MPVQTAPSVLIDPREAGPKPPFPEQPQPMPGSDRQLTPQADHGERSYKGSGKLEGCKAIITGADSGIGRAVAIAFAREGADLVLSYLEAEQSDAEETARWVRDAGREAVLAPGDLTRRENCEALVDRAVRELGDLDIVVSNAAFQTTHEDADQWNPEEFDHTYKTNVYPLFWLTRAALKHLRPGGSILATASVQAFQPSGQLLAYSSTKGAIATFIKALGELAIQHGVRANAVAPGPVWTPLIPSTMPQEKVKNFGGSTTIGRPAQPAELAGAYVFLASNDARYITSSVVDVTGGSMLT